MKYVTFVIIFVLFFVFGCVAVLMWKWSNEIDKALVPEHISLDTAKYKILKEDSLTLEGMKIRRIYYLRKK